MSGDGGQRPPGRAGAEAAERRALLAEIRQATGRTYRIALDRLDLTDLTEMRRMLRDLAYERQAAINRARMQPWRR